MNAQPMVWEIRFKDMASKAVRQFGSTTKQEADKARTAFQKVAGVVKTLTGRFVSLTAAAVGITTIVTTLQNVFRILRQGVGDAVNFSKAMVEVSTISEDVAQNMGSVTRQVLDLSTAFGVAETTASKALYQTISAGVTDTAEAMELLEGATTLSIGGLADLKSTVDVLTDTINAYGFTVQDVEHINNVFFETVRLGKTTVQELAEGLGVVTPVAAELGVELEELMAMLATLTKGGIDNTTAIIYMRQALVSVLKPSTQAQELIENLGLEFNLAKIETDGFIGLLADLREKLDGDTYALQTLFPNVRALVPVMALAGSRFEEFNTILGELSRSSLDEAAPAMRALERVMLSSGRQIEVLGNAARQGIMELGLAFIEGLTGPIDSVEALQGAAFAIRDGIAGMAPVLNAFAGSLLYVISVIPEFIGIFANLASELGLGDEVEANLRMAANGMDDIGDLAREAATSLIVGGEGAAGALARFSSGLEQRKRELSDSAIQASNFAGSLGDLRSVIVQLSSRKIEFFDPDFGSRATEVEGRLQQFGDAIRESMQEIGGAFVDVNWLGGTGLVKGKEAVVDAFEDISVSTDAGIEAIRASFESAGSLLGPELQRSLEKGFKDIKFSEALQSIPLPLIADQLDIASQGKDAKAAYQAAIALIEAEIERGAKSIADIDLPPAAMAVIGQALVDGLDQADEILRRRLADFKARAGREFTTVFDEILRTVNASELEAIFADISIKTPGLDRLFADAQKGLRSGGTATFKALKESLPADEFARIAAEAFIQMGEQVEAAAKDGIISPKALQNLRTQVKALQAELKRLGGPELQEQLESMVMPDVEIPELEIDPLLTEEAIEATKKALRDIGLELEILEAKASKSFSAQREEIRLTTQEAIREAQQRFQSNEITGAHYEKLVQAFLAGERAKLAAVDQSERDQAAKREQAAERARKAQQKILKGYQDQIKAAAKTGDASKVLANIIQTELAGAFTSFSAVATGALSTVTGMLGGLQGAAIAAAAAVAGLAAELSGLSASQVAAKIGGDLASLVGSVDLPVIDRLKLLDSQLETAATQIAELRALNLVSPEVLADLERLTALAEQGAYSKIAEDATSAGEFMQVASNLISQSSEQSMQALLALQAQMEGLDLEQKFQAMGGSLGALALNSFDQLASMAPEKLELMVTNAQAQLDALAAMQFESEDGQMMPLVSEDEVAQMQARIDMINATAVAQANLNQKIMDYVTASGKGSAEGNAFRGSLQNLATQFSNIGQLAGDLVANQLQALTGGLGDMFAGIMDGSKDSSEAWKQFALDFVKGLVKMTMQMLMMYGVSLLLQAMGIPVGPMMGVGAGAGGGGVSAQANGAVNEGGLGTLVNLKDAVAGFANGGVVEGLGRMMPVRGYANGGPVVNEPHVALIGEGKYNEAVVPLPDGRSIPVQMTGQQDARPVNVNFNIQSFDSKDVTRVIAGQEEQIKGMIMQAVNEDRMFRSRMR